MRKVAMCFSLFQFPRYRIQTLANSWQESFLKLNRRDFNSSTFKVFGSGYRGLDGGQFNRSSKHTITSNTESGKKAGPSSNTSIQRDSLDKTTIANLNTHKTRITKVEKAQVLDVRQKISENKELVKLVTFIAFDIETTGLSRKVDRIIEIALQDLAGGSNSTFQALVNPERSVRNSYIHRISNDMVNRPDVPRMEDLIPVLLQYIKSRQKPNGFVVLIAHNGRSFDVPFLYEEFMRCSYKIPSDWLFVDTVQIARDLMKSQGVKGQSVKLEVLGNHFKIQSEGPAHRALADVRMLSLILQKLTYEMKLPVCDMIEKYSFTDLYLEEKRMKESSS